MGADFGELLMSVFGLSFITRTDLSKPGST